MSEAPLHRGTSLIRMYRVTSLPRKGGGAYPVRHFWEKSSCSRVSTSLARSDLPIWQVLQSKCGGTWVVPQ